MLYCCRTAAGVAAETAAAAASALHTDTLRAPDIALVAVGLTAGVAAAATGAATVVAAFASASCNKLGCPICYCMPWPIPLSSSLR